MGFIDFVVWFAIGLVGTFGLCLFFSSAPFITAFIVAIVMGVLGALRDM